MGEGFVTREAPEAFAYVNTFFDEDGWASASTSLPIPYELVI